MKKTLMIISAFVLLTGTSCKSKEKASNDESNATNSKTMQSEKKYRFIVSFFSIGTGLDSDAYTKFENFVKNHPSKPSYDTYRWGREGETDISFSLNEFKKEADKTKFIEELKAAIGKSDRVRYKENEVPAGKMPKKVE